MSELQPGNPILITRILPCETGLVHRPFRAISSGTKRAKPITKGRDGLYRLCFERSEFIMLKLQQEAGFIAFLSKENNSHSVAFLLVFSWLLLHFVMVLPHMHSDHSITVLYHMLLSDFRSDLFDHFKVKMQLLKETFKP